MFNEKTGLWATGRDELQEKYKDDMGHGTTVYPRLPQVFDDPAHAVADALLNAKTPEETKMVLDRQQTFARSAAKVFFTLSKGDTPILEIQLRYKGDFSAFPQFFAGITPEFKEMIKKGDIGI